MSALFFTHIPKTAGTDMRAAVFNPSVARHARHRWKRVQSSIRSSVDFRLLVGHYPYGVHRLYGVSAPRYFVLLRHPIERAISHYYFIKDANSPTYRHPQSSIVEDHTLVSLHEQPAFQNVQTRYISGLF
jgi:predicted nucleotidyltransferase